jgi:hypothetical protein
MSFFKDHPARDPAYRKWVKSQPSVISGEVPAGDSHHIKGHGLGGSVKCSDYYTIPLTRAEHREFHAMGFQSWEAKHGSQLMFALKTLERWVREEGVNA